MPDDGTDLRDLINPIDAVIATQPKYREVPESSYTPPATDDDPDPDPVVTPAYTEVYTDPTELPDVITSGDGVNLGAQVSMLHSALAWYWSSQQIRTVEASETVNDESIWAAGSSRDIDLTWSTTPLLTPTGVIPNLDVGVAWQGKVTAALSEGSITDTGCTMTVTVVSDSAVIPNGENPITIRATGVYLYVPPWEG